MKEQRQDAAEPRVNAESDCLHGVMEARHLEAARVLRNLDPADWSIETIREAQAVIRALALGYEAITTLRPIEWERSGLQFKSWGTHQTPDGTVVTRVTDPSSGRQGTGRGADGVSATDAALRDLRADQS